MRRPEDTPAELTCGYASRAVASAPARGRVVSRGEQNGEGPQRSRPPARPVAVVAQVMLLSAGAPTARPQAAKLRPNRPGRASAGGPAPCRAAKTFVDHTSQLTDTTELKVEVFAQPDEVSN